MWLLWFSFWWINSTLIKRSYWKCQNYQWNLKNVSVTNLVKFECKKCDSNFDYHHHLEKHIATVHEEKKPFKFENCNFNVSQKGCACVFNLNKFECKICDSNFDYVNQMEKHFATVHGGKKPFKCEICNHNVSQKGNVSVNYHHHLEKHIVVVHEEKKPFKCEICEYKCSEKGSLKHHVASVHEGKKQF